MDEKELKLVLDKLNEEQKSKFESMKEEFKQGFISEKVFEESMKGFAKENDIKGLSDSIEKLGIEIKAMAEVKKTEKVKTLKEEVTDQHASLLKALKEDGKKSFTMSLKTNVTSASITDDSQGVYLPGFGQQAFRGLVFEQYFQRFTLPSNHHGTVYYVDQTTVTRNAANKAEAAAANESAVAWTQYSLGMGKILDSIPLTHEAMMDIDQLTAEVQMFINNNIRLAVDLNMWSGNGTLPNWKGIYTYATDFTSTIALAQDKVDDASLYDLLVKIRTYGMASKESKYDFNVVFLNPNDTNKMKLKKDANNNYIIPPFVSPDGKIVDGVQIVESSAITANTMAMGDSRMVRYYDVEGIDLEFGLDSDDFTKDLITLKGRKRGNLLLRTVDATAWYKVTDIDTRIANITA